MILAAGKGTRLRPITETRPKPLIPVLCKPLLYWHLDALARINGLDEVVIVASYMRDAVEKAARQHPLADRIRVIEQGEEKGTGHAVQKAMEALGNEGEALIVYGDIFLGDWSIYRRVAQINGNAVVGVRVDEPREYGVFVVENNMVKGVVEKPEEPPSDVANAGIYKFDLGVLGKAVENLPVSPRGEIEFTDAVNNAASMTEIRLLTIDRDSWIDVGRPWNILDANRMALGSISTEIKGVVEKGAYIHGRVYVGEGSIVKSGSYIEGPVYIGRDVTIGPNARIRPYTVICDKAVVGFSVEVKASLIMEDADIHHLSYVGDSIVCEHVNLGAGTITANLRFDEAPIKMIIKDRRVSSGRKKLGAVIGGYAKTGINVSILPGIKIGSYSWIYPGAVVTRDVPSRHFYKVRTEYYLEPLQ